MFIYQSLVLTLLYLAATNFCSSMNIVLARAIRYC